MRPVRKYCIVKVVVVNVNLLKMCLDTKYFYDRVTMLLSGGCHCIYCHCLDGGWMLHTGRGGDGGASGHMMPSCVQWPGCCCCRRGYTAILQPATDQPGSVLGLGINMFISHHGSTINMHYMLTLHTVKQTERQRTCHIFLC